MSWLDENELLFKDDVVKTPTNSDEKVVTGWYPPNSAVWYGFCKIMKAVCFIIFLVPIIWLIFSRK